MMMESCKGNVGNTCPLRKKKHAFISTSVLLGQQPQHLRANAALSHGSSCKISLGETTLKLLLEELAEQKRAACFDEETGGCIELDEQQHL